MALQEFDRFLEHAAETGFFVVRRDDDGHEDGGGLDGDGFEGFGGFAGASGEVLARDVVVEPAGERLRPAGGAIGEDGRVGLLRGEGGAGNGCDDEE